MEQLYFLEKEWAAVTEVSPSAQSKHFHGLGVQKYM